MKLNIIGIIGAVIAFISSTLPWWAISLSIMGTPFSDTMYLYQTGDFGYVLSLWYVWAAFALVILGGLLGLAGSIVPKGKMLLIGGGVLALLSIIIFAVGLQTDLSSSGAPFGLFSSSSSGTGYITSYSTYLSFGFWLALVSFIVMLVASFRKLPQTIPSTPPPPPQPPT